VASIEHRDQSVRPHPIEHASEVVQGLHRSRFQERERFQHQRHTSLFGAPGQPAVLIHLLFVLVWVRRSGRWRLVHRHATRIVDPA
jgi:hypothetical protein